jgi:hypothetical protein
MNGTMSTPVKFNFNLDRRSGRERRQRQQQTFCFGNGSGRRRSIRRRRDRAAVYHPDRYSSILFGMIVSILFLSVVDAYLTLFLIDHGAAELNPLMAFYLDIGPQAFLLVKYGLTSSSVLVLLLLSNFLLPGLKINTGSMFMIIFTVFASVVAWELYLVIRHVP